MITSLLLLIQSYTGLYAESAITSYNQIQPRVSVSAPAQVERKLVLPEIKPLTISINRSIETSA